MNGLIVSALVSRQLSEVQLMKTGEEVDLELTLFGQLLFPRSRHNKRKKERKKERKNFILRQ